jgi:hypothetical protein
MQQAPSASGKRQHGLDLQVSFFPFDSDWENRKANPALVSAHGRSTSVNILQCHSVANIVKGDLLNNI